MQTKQAAYFNNLDLICDNQLTHIKVVSQKYHDIMFPV